MVRHRLDIDDVARLDLEHGRQVAVEVAPKACLGAGHQTMRGGAAAVVSEGVGDLRREGRSSHRVTIDHRYFGTLRTLGAPKRRAE